MEAEISQENNYKQELDRKTRMPLLWVGLASIVMLFASLTSAVIVSKSSRDWVSFELPFTFGISTLTILLSSLTYWWAYKSAKAGNFGGLKTGVLLTLILGLGFAALQFISWGILVDQGIFFAGASSTVSGSFLYAISGLHLAHMVGGLVSLGIVYFKASRNRYSTNNLLGLQASTTYWHFLDGLWIYLYLFLNFIAL
ncbi:MAG: cytochrome c oxidase subunit 3 [Vicingaceae bacterium]